MPGDVLGTNLFNFQTNTFVLTKGPIFTQMLLADEINRTPPKTQAALLAGDERARRHHRRQDYPLGDDFMVVATQNPIEQQGTYPLPEAQLDRFLFKIMIDYPSRDEEREIVRRHGHRSAHAAARRFRPQAGRRRRAGSPPCAPPSPKSRCRTEMVAYIVDMVRATREHSASKSAHRRAPANMLGRRRPAPTRYRRAATSSSPTTSRRSPCRRCAIASPCHRAPRSKGSTTDRILREVLDQTPAPR